MTLPEVEELPSGEISGWLAYFVVKGESPYAVHRKWLDATKQR